MGTSVALRNSWHQINVVMKLPFLHLRRLIAAPTLRVVALVGAGVLVSANSTQGQAAPDGEWAGALRLPSETLYVRVNVTQGGSDATVLGALPRPLRAIGAKRTALGFELRLVGGADTLELQGVRRGDTLSGGVARQRGGGDFTFVRVIQVNPELFDEYAGGYELPSGRFVFITRGDRMASKPPFAVERSWLQFFDDAGATRLLFPTSQSEFVAGPAYAIPAPVTVHVKFLRDAGGRVTGLRWRDGPASDMYARRTSRYASEEIRFAHDSLAFAGRLLVPSGRGTYPAIVLLPGGPGAAGRNENYFGVAHLLASAGFATLAFEKRGVGASTGDWRAASYVDFARDAIAAVRYLQHRPDIDAQCVGLFGISEGGWVAPLAAHLSPEVAFVAVVGASGKSHPEADLALLEIALRADSFAEGDRLRALELERAMIEYARTRQNWTATRAQLDTILTGPWLSHSVVATHTSYDFPTTEDHWFWTLYGLDAGYDPSIALRELRVPLLAVWGDLDPASPPALNVPAFESARAGRGAESFRLVVLPRGDHTLWEFPFGNTSTFHLVRRFVPGYFDLLRDWFGDQASTCRARNSRPRRPR